MDTLSNQLIRAGNAFSEGNFPEAEAICRGILDQQPDFVDALVLRCGVAARQGNRPLALEMIQRAVAVAPDRADCHNTLGQILASMGQTKQALAAFEKAAELKPDFAEVHYNLGLARRARGQDHQAAERFETAATLRPDWAEAHFALANVRAALAQWPAAVDEYRRALERRPDAVEILYNLGGAFQAQGKLDEARDAYNDAIERRPDFAPALNNLGVVLRQLGDLAGAGNCYRKALAMEPDNPETHNNLGNVLEKIDCMDEAVAHCRRAVFLRPDFVEAHNNLGVALNGVGRFEEGDAAFCQALVLRPDFTEARFNHAVTRLLLGDFAEGWPAYESRFDRADWTHIHPHRYSMPRWQGEPFAGRRLYVHDEQGFGDTLQFVRYLPRVKALGGTVIFETRLPLIPLLAGMAGVDELVDRPAGPEPAAACDLVVPLMSLAGIFQTRPDTVPAPVPYLATNRQRADHWRQVVGQAGLRIGLVWAGSPNHEQDRRRSCPLDLFAPLAQIPGVHLFGLQKGPGAERAAGFLQENLGARFDDFADTAAAIAAMDLVISVDTAVAHLAGAMGKEVWILIAHAPDWRWGLAGDRTPWYPTMTLFRQRHPGDWTGVMARVAQALGDRAAATTGRGSPLDGETLLAKQFRQAARLHHDGRAAAAEALCREILAVSPDRAETLNLAAILAQERGGMAEAAAFMARAVAAAPDNPLLHRNRGRILARAGNHRAAAESFQRAFELAPDDAGQAMDWARALAAGGRPKAAESVCRRLIAADPDHVGALTLLGTVLGRMGRAEEAMTLFDRALAVDPASADAWTNKGVLFHSDGRLDEAMAAFDRAVTAGPGHADARFNRGQVRLLTGDFAGGWADYEARCEKPAWQRANPEISQQRRWRGEPVAGKTLFVCDEQGLGDTLQFVRYLPMVKARCEQVVLVCGPPLVPLLAGSAGADAVTVRREGMPGQQGRTVSLLSLPKIFGTVEETIPADIPYLFADAQKAAAWRKKMPGPGLRVGLVWSGNPDHANDSKRSCSLKSLAPILELPGVTWFGLQKGAGGRQVQELPEPLQFCNLGPDLADFSDTAAALANLDLVVTVDTAVAHLAGAMGKPVWVMVPAVPDWRWLMDREDSPWYPTMGLFRQMPGEGWGPVAGRVAVALSGIVKERTMASGAEGYRNTVNTGKDIR